MVTRRSAMIKNHNSTCSEDEDINLSEGAESKAEGSKMATGIEGVKDKDARILSPPDGDNCKGKGSKVFGESQHSGKDTGFDGVDFLEGINLYDDDKDSAMLATKALSEQNDIPVKLKDTNLDIAELSQEQQEFMRELVAKFKNKKADIIKNVDGQAEILYSVRDLSTEPKKNLTEIFQQNLEEKKGEVSEKKAQTDVDKHFNTACDSSEPKDIPDVDFQSKNSSITHPRHSGKDKGDVTVTSADKGVQDDSKNEEDNVPETLIVDSVKKESETEGCSPEQGEEPAKKALINQDENLISIETLRKEEDIIFLVWKKKYTKFFQKLDNILTKDMTVQAFFQENFNIKNKKDKDIFDKMSKNGQVYMNGPFGNIKNAIISKMNTMNEQLPTSVAFTIVSNERFFYNVEEQMSEKNNSLRSIRVVDFKDFRGEVTVTSADKDVQDDSKNEKWQSFEEELSNQDENFVSIENLKKKKCLYFLDMDNCASFFKRICRIPSKDVLVWGFCGENYKVGSENFNETYFIMKSNRTVYLNDRCGGTKDATDFSIAVTVGRLDALLDNDVEFFIVSGDKGLQEIKRRLKDNDINSSRKVTMVEPKKINELF